MSWLKFIIVYFSEPCLDEMLAGESGEITASTNETDISSTIFDANSTGVPFLANQSLTLQFSSPQKVTTVKLNVSNDVEEVVIEYIQDGETIVSTHVVIQWNLS